MKNYFYYLTVTNERYAQPPKPKGKDVDSNIIKGMHRISKTKKPQIRLLGSGAILNESIKAAEILSGYGIESEVWSVTSFNMLRKDGMEVENESIKNASNKAKESFVAESFSEHDVPTVASTDYMRAYSEQIRPYINSSYYTLGTDGFGRSDSRAKLREFFEVDAKSIVMTSAYALHKEDKLNKTELQKIYKEIKVNKDKIAPWNT